MKFILRFTIQFSICGSLILSSCAQAEKSRMTAAATQTPAASAPIASLPADIVLSAGIMLQARVNNSGPLWFALDSGAGSGFVVDRRRADKLGLKLRGRAKSTGAGENYYDVAFANDVRLGLTGVELPPQTVRVISLESLEPFAGRTLDGILGSALFTHYVVEIDYAGGKVNLYEPQGYQYFGRGVSLPLTFEGDHFFVSARVTFPGRAAFEGKFLVDTGAVVATLIINRPTVEKQNLLASLTKKFIDRSNPGLGGETKQVLARAQSVQLSGITIDQPTLTLSQDSGGALASPDYDGIIGDELLRRFKVIFDTAHDQLILEPNAKFTEPYEHDMSGIGLRAEGRDFKTFKIHRIIEGSPAAEAGLREGDVIASINGQPDVSLDQLYGMFKQDVRELDLSIVRGGKKMQARLKLRRLV